jgi:hypothetical protein
MTTNSDKTIVKRVKASLKSGHYLYEALAEAGISSNRWYRICDSLEIKVPGPRGKIPTTYTPERVKQVKKRINSGELLKDVAKDMGMDPRNLARYCRNNGITLFSKKALADNYKKRGESMRGQKRKPYASRNGEPLKRAEVIKLLKKGKSVDYIEDHSDASRHYIYALRKEFIDNRIS